jgi:hypothetical protein
MPSSEERHDTPDEGAADDIYLAGTSASPAPSDVAYRRVRGHAPRADFEDTEATKVAREAAFGASTEDAEPDPSSVSKTRSPEPGEGDATVEADEAPKESDEDPSDAE